MKRLFVFAALTFSLSAFAMTHSSGGRADENISDTSAIVDFDSSQWVITSPQAKKEEYQGRKGLFLSAGAFAYLKDAEFEDGTIEVDMAATTPRAFLGIVFRFESKDEHEIMYLRPHKSGLDDATQYAPSFNGSTPWQLYSGPGFTAAAEIPKNQWFRVKMVIEGLTARVYINDSAEPALTVNDLKRGYSKGTVGLWGSAMGGYFSNFKYTAAAPAANRPGPKYPAMHAGMLTKWELSEAFDTEEKNPEMLPPAAAMKAMKWQAVTVESPGMVVIDRYRRSPGILPPFASNPSARLQKAKGTKVVFARATIESDRDQVRKMSFGYSDEASIFLNGQILFAGKSAFRFRDPGFLGIMDVDNDAVYLPLKKGKNELVLAVTEYFGGWGYICRLENTEGIKIN